MVNFEDNFKDNSNNWWTGSIDRGEMKIEDGEFQIEHFFDTGIWFVTQNFPFQPQKAYEIETKIRFYYGVEDHGYGIVWNDKRNEKNDSETFYIFIVSPNGQYCIRSFENHKYVDIQPWTQHDSVKHSGNKLKIIHFDNVADAAVYFMINDQLVFTAIDLPLSGMGIGMVVNNKMWVGCHFFKVSYNDK
jgi:phenylpropionate dioxygenase-like ring-hydroxylating dioxygenase large terminal subunit